MQPEQIKTSDLLDILFADRNKMYGAYPLRRGYSKRLAKALIITGGIVTLALGAYYSSGKTTIIEDAMQISSTVELEDPARKEPEPPLPPPPPPPPVQRVATVRNVVPIVVRDEQADAPPPTVDELARSVSGLINQDGIDDPKIVAPPIENSNSVVETPKSTNEKEFIPVEIESTYPGGMAAWRRFLIKTLNYPEEAKQNGIYGAVTVKFIVDGDGKVSNIEAVSGPQELRSEAIRVISKSGKWTPAQQNGNYVKSIKLQQIIFTLQNE